MGIVYPIVYPKGTGFVAVLTSGTERVAAA
jgi:hypothetical protein